MVVLAPPSQLAMLHQRPVQGPEPPVPASPGVIDTPASVIVSPPASTSLPVLTTDLQSLGSHTLAQLTGVPRILRPVAPSTVPGTLLATRRSPMHSPHVLPSH